MDTLFLKNIVTFIFFIILSSTSLLAQTITDNNKESDEGFKGKVLEATKNVKRASKKGIRTMQDETCEVINGKTKCLPKKIKHEIENEADKIKDMKK